LKVRDLIRLVEEDGCYLHSTRGCHRQYKHPVKTGRVTIPGKPGDDVTPPTFASALKQANIRKPSSPMQYAVVIEKVPDSNYSAYVPDLPGCISTGDTLEEAKVNIHAAIEFHLDGMRQDGDPIPEPTTQVAYAEVV
jgi:predicted RNase H-like HicB family nuclease/predicted RNA binding protein YcfA (HicA-like mRNA interferase family)